MDIQSHIKGVIHESSSSHPGSLREQDLLQALREKGVVDDIMRQLQFDSGGQHMSNGKPATHFIDTDDKVAISSHLKKGM